MNQKSFDFEHEEYNVLKNISNVAGVISEVDRLKAAKQILLGLQVMINLKPLI